MKKLAIAALIFALAACEAPPPPPEQGPPKPGQTNADCPPDTQCVEP